jgi:hypothetical protein
MAKCNLDETTYTMIRFNFNLDGYHKVNNTSKELRIEAYWDEGLSRCSLIWEEVTSSLERYELPRRTLERHKDSCSSAWASPQIKRWVTSVGLKVTSKPSQICTHSKSTTWKLPGGRNALPMVFHKPKSKKLALCIQGGFTFGLVDRRTGHLLFSPKVFEFGSENERSSSLFWCLTMENNKVRRAMNVCSKPTSSRRSGFYSWKDTDVA